MRKNKIRKNQTNKIKIKISIIRIFMNRHKKIRIIQYLTRYNKIEKIKKVQ